MGENGKIRVLLPGPTSYLGRRLMFKLLDRPEVRLRVLSVDRRSLGDAAEAIPEIVEGDPLDAEVLRRATEGIDIAFYPVRFVGADAEFEERRRVFPSAPGKGAASAGSAAEGRRAARGGAGRGRAGQARRRRMERGGMVPKERSFSLKARRSNAPPSCRPASSVMSLSSR